ncbi:MAG: hypothetical protein ACRDIU_08275 [Actinomycetota bacterium]
MNNLVKKHAFRRVALALLKQEAGQLGWFIVGAVVGVLVIILLIVKLVDALI